MHIADAFLTPMVIMYSGTEYESQWRPRNAPTTLLRKPTLCSPCYNFRCPYNMECLDFTPQQVAAEAIKMLEIHSTPTGIYEPVQPVSSMMQE